MTTLHWNREKTLDALKYLLALRVYNEPFTILPHAATSLVLRSQTFFCPHAATRYPQCNQASGWPKQQRGQRRVYRMDRQDEQKHRASGTQNTRHQCTRSLTQPPTPSALVIFAMIFHTQPSLLEYPNLKTWMANLQSTPAFAAAIRDWTSEVVGTVCKSSILVLDHHVRKM